MAQKTVGFALYPNCTLLDFAGATQVFAFSGYDTVWLAESCCPVMTTEGVSVLPGRSFKDFTRSQAPIDILFVPGGAEAVTFMMFDADYIGFLRETASRCQWAGSVCTGAFLLAAAGLLDGCRATTYWSQIDNLRLFPKLLVAEGYPRAVLDEPRRRFTGGGVSSSIDLALELLERLDGPQARQSAQLSIQYAPDPPPPDTGDPGHAPVELVSRIRGLQEQDFIQPYRAAVEKWLGRNG